MLLEPLTNFDYLLYYNDVNFAKFDELYICGSIFELKRGIFDSKILGDVELDKCALKYYDWEQKENLLMSPCLKVESFYLKSVSANRILAMEFKGVFKELEPSFSKKYNINLNDSVSNNKIDFRQKQIR